MTLQVRRASAAEIVPIRHAVLRPGRPVSTALYAEDDRAVHVGAWESSSDGELLVGCATVFPQPWPGDDDPAAPPPEPGAWRLRGMAVDPSRQGSGAGRQVLALAVELARAAGAPLLWADGRTSALGFYERLGWQVVGEEYVVAASGLPHRRIVLDLNGSAEAVGADA
ncbi:MAG TPA: GNAT family N-acetyltransferase [Mycobacteriales bacterium]|nr:GNAT family N-acetyltransferase [Mycobacteriales bacterium]